MKVSKGYIKVQNSDGSFTEHQFTMPHAIAEDVLCQIIDWKNLWKASFNEVEDYQQSINEFESKLKGE